MNAYDGGRAAEASEYVTDAPAGSSRGARVGQSSLALDLLERALDEDPTSTASRGVLRRETGEGRGTYYEAVRLAVPLNRDHRVAVRRPRDRMTRRR